MIYSNTTCNKVIYTYHSNTIPFNLVDIPENSLKEPINIEVSCKSVNYNLGNICPDFYKLCTINHINLSEIEGTPSFTFRFENFFTFYNFYI